MPQEKVFLPESGEANLNIQRLTPQSPEAEIRGAFIRWSKEVLMPMLDDIIQILEAAYIPYGEMRLIRSQRVAEAKADISGAIRTLKTQRTVYCEMIKTLSSATTLNQFLTIMGLLEPGVPHEDWFPVPCGMNVAEIGGRYKDELWPAIKFRYYEARRITEGNLDMSYRNVLDNQWREREIQDNVKNLDNLGEDQENNARILYGYFRKVLHPLICEIFKMDPEQKAQWWSVFEDISPSEKETPSFESLLNGLLRWRSRVEAYSDSLPEGARQNPNYETVTQKLFGYIDLLCPHLVRLQTAGEVKGTE